MLSHQKNDNPIVSELYGGQIKVQFNPLKHQYLVNGQVTISVTSALQMLNKPALVFWSANLMRDYLLDHVRKGMKITESLILEGSKQHTIKKEREATSGTLVHQFAEQYIKGLNPDMPEDDRAAFGATAFLKWVTEHEIKFLASEKIVYSRQFDYVGIMDCTFTMGSEDHKIVHAGDFKTSSGIYNEMRYQVSAYQYADTEESGREYGDKWIIRFDKNTGEFEAKNFSSEDHPKDFVAFLGLLQVKRRERELS